MHPRTRLLLPGEMVAAETAGDEDRRFCRACPMQMGERRGGRAVCGRFDSCGVVWVLEDIFFDNALMARWTLVVTDSRGPTEGGRASKSFALLSLGLKACMQIERTGLSKSVPPLQVVVV